MIQADTYRLDGFSVFVTVFSPVDCRRKEQKY